MAPVAEVVAPAPDSDSLVVLVCVVEAVEVVEDVSLVVVEELERETFGGMEVLLPEAS